MKRKLGIIVLCISIVALLSSAGIWMYNTWDENRAGDSADLTTQLLYDAIAEVVTENSVKYIGYTSLPSSESAENTPSLVEINGEFYLGVINIPAFSLELPVNNEWSDERLEKSPCRYMGDITRSMVISAHNYNSHFGRISNLAVGDKIIITDVIGNKHWYNVELLDTLHETEISAMINSPYDLTLFTCTLDRRHRTTIRCNKMNLKNTPYPEYAIVQGQINGNVLLIQKYLNIIGSIQPAISYLEEDGSFGPATYEAVQKFQELYELAVDGSIGYLTWNKIVEVYNSLQ